MAGKQQSTDTRGHSSRQSAAFAAAVLQGVLHGALKASNVLLTAQRRYQIADYALHNNVSCGGDASTPAHLPPEALQGGPPTRAADVYAFGMLMWQL